MSGLISVLVVNFNGGEMLLRALDELRVAAASTPHEVIVADNGSTDGSIERLRLERPEVSLIELGDNLGFGAANNRAAAVARGDQLLLLNSDAWPRPGCLEALAQALEERQGLGLVAPRLFFPDGRPQFHWAPTTSVVGEALQMVRNRFESLALLHHPFPGRGWFTAACLLIRRHAFEQIGGFDERFFLYFEDVDLCLRLRAAGWDLGEARGAGCVHVKGGSQPGGQSELHYRRGQLLYYARHRPAWENAVLRLKLRRKLVNFEEPERSELEALLDAPAQPV